MSQLLLLQCKERKENRTEFYQGRGDLRLGDPCVLLRLFLLRFAPSSRQFVVVAPYRSGGGFIRGPVWLETDHPGC